jgi:hypothetical protein
MGSGTLSHLKPLQIATARRSSDHEEEDGKRKKAGKHGNDDA